METKKLNGVIGKGPDMYRTMIAYFERQNVWFTLEGYGATEVQISSLAWGSSGSSKNIHNIRCRVVGGELKGRTFGGMYSPSVGWNAGHYQFDSEQPICASCGCKTFQCVPRFTASVHLELGGGIYHYRHRCRECDYEVSYGESQDTALEQGSNPTETVCPHCKEDVRGRTL